MSGKIEKNCPNCDQLLRFPENVGGVVMVCPSCGHKFKSDFKLRIMGDRSMARKSRKPNRAVKPGSGFRITI